MSESEETTNSIKSPTHHQRATSSVEYNRQTSNTINSNSSRNNRRVSDDFSSGPIQINFHGVQLQRQPSNSTLTPKTYRFVNDDGTEEIRAFFPRQLSIHRQLSLDIDAEDSVHFSSGIPIETTPSSSQTSNSANDPTTNNSTDIQPASSTVLQTPSASTSKSSSIVVTPKSTPNYAFSNAHFASASPRAGYATMPLSKRTTPLLSSRATTLLRAPSALLTEIAQFSMKGYAESHFRTVKKRTGLKFKEVSVGEKISWQKVSSRDQF